MDFFNESLAAVKARKLGNALLTEAMNRDGRVSLKSYDRVFPSQDYLPKGGFGNLVALPLQGKARKKKCISVKFKGKLREEQDAAIASLMAHDTGVLNATTAFGKTVTAIGLIAKRKINALILLLLARWIQMGIDFMGWLI